MLLNVCLRVDFVVDNIGRAIWPLYLTLLTVTAAVSVVWIFRRQRYSILESQCHAPTPFLEYKSLESTMNDFDENAFRQPVDDLGKGILDRQSGEVDANESRNNINFSQQLASLECTADGKLTVPQNKFELSAFTKQSKLFGNYFTALSICDNSGRIDVNFSAIQQVEKNDLDEFEKYLERGSSNMGCHGVFSNGQNMAEHIEVELKTTHTVVKNDEDMSITDTVHIPLQDLSKNASKDKKASLNNDWVTDKENIAMNPYAAPSEISIAVNEEPDQVLVFDDKRLTLQPDITEKDKNCRETLLSGYAPSLSGKSSQHYVNSLVIQQVGKDDLDEIEEDLERGSSYMGCHGVFSNGQNMAEHIEVEQNTTHTVVKNNEDMSITNNVHIPLQDLSKSASKDKKASLNNDWVADKENIAMNPYAAPSETNGPVNEESDQVLVFDGKRLTLQPNIPEKVKNCRVTLLSSYASSMSGKSSQHYVNSLVIQQVRKDDLDEIEEDLERGSSYMGCHGVFSNGQNMAEHIEVELNTTHTVVKNNEDMSITDTVHIPLQDLSKSASKDKKAGLNNYWVADKENIATNPYAAPSEISIAVNEEPDQVLVFDDKRLTLQPDITEKNKNCRETLLSGYAPSLSGKSSQHYVNSLVIQQVGKYNLGEIEEDLESGSSYMGCHGVFSNEQNMAEHIEVEQNTTHTVVKNDEDMSITDTVHIPLQDLFKSASKDKKASLNNNWVADKENIAGNLYAAPSETNVSVNEEQVFDGKLLTLQPDILDKDKNFRDFHLPNSAPSMSGKSSQNYVNASVIQQVVNDDLDEIGKYLEWGLSNVIQSENTEINLILTHTVVQNDEDMTITDTVHSSLQDVTKSASTDMKVSVNKDLVADKENTASNPYAPAPSESDEELKQVVVIDVKRSTLLPAILEEDKDYRQTLSSNSSAKTPQSFVLNVNDDLPKSNDGMLNSKCKNSGFSGSKAKRKKIKRYKNEIPDTVPVHKVVITPKYDKASKREAIVFNDGACNVCFTKALPANMMLLNKQAQQNCQTIEYENDSENISDIQTCPINVILPNTSPKRQKMVLYEDPKNPERRRTVVYKDDTDNTSVTQALQSNILPEKVQLVDNKNNEAENILISQSFLNYIVAIDSKTSRYKTIVYKNDTENISITQVKQQLKPGYSEEKPIVHLKTSSKPRSKKRTTIVNDNDESHIFMTESISTNLMGESTNERKTIAYDDVDSKSLAILTNIYLLDGLDSTAHIKKPEEFKEVKEKVIDDGIIEEAINKIKTITYDEVEKDEGDIVKTRAISTSIMKESTNERKTIAYDDVYSKSLAISTNVYLLAFSSSAVIKKPEEIKEVKDKVIDDGIIDEAINKIKPITYGEVDNDEGDILLTGAISTNEMEESTNERKTIPYDDVYSKSLAISTNVYLLDELYSGDSKKTEKIKDVLDKVIDDGIMEEAIDKIKTITYDEVDTDEGDIFMTGAISTHIMEESTNESKTMAYDEVDTDEGNIFKTKAKSNSIMKESINERKTNAYDEVDSKSIARSTNVYLLDKQDSTADMTKPIITNKEKVIDNDVFEQDNLKLTEDALKDKRKSTVFDANNFDSETSITMGIETVSSLLQTEKRRTVIFGNDNCNISMKHPTPAELINYETELLNITKTKSSNLTKQNRAANPQSDIIVLQAFTTNSKQLTARISEQINLKNPYVTTSYLKVQKDNNSKVATLNTQKVVNLPEIPISAIVMPVHPRGIEKLQVKLITSTTDRKKDKVSEGDDDSVTKESLTKISDQTLQRGTYDKSFMAILESDPPSTVMPQDAAAKTSTECMFCIMKDNEVATQTDRKMDNKAKRANPKDEEEQVFHLLRQLSELKTATQNSAIPSKSFEIDKINEHVNIKQQSYNSSRPNDTQDLLELISNFTGNVVCEDNVQPVGIKVADQGETTEHKQVSTALNGQSIALIEDLLRNILKAQELLQKCRMTLDNRDCADEDTKDASVEISNKTDRRSYKVEQTFKFGEESISEASLTCEEKFSPLKKTAFGETAYMYETETKGKVIPAYLKNVSDGIKELMLDLIKPVSNDNMPVEIRLIDKDVMTQNTSSHSAQIQVNLAKSSHKMENTLKPKQSMVLLFDYLIPLNNIVLAPNYSKDGHKYNPRETDETRGGSGELLKKIYKGNNYEAETLTTTHFTMMLEPSTMQDDICVYQKDDRFSKKDDQFSSQSTSTTNRCIPVDKSVFAISRNVRNAKVNTEKEKKQKEMGKNSELLGASLLLDLVEDASDDANRALKSDSNKHTNLKVKFSISPHVNIKGEAAKIFKAAKLSGISIRQRFKNSNSRVSETNSKTRICSPSTDKHEQYSPSEEVILKPITKISKSSKPHEVSAVLSLPDDPTKSLRTEENFLIFVEQSFRPAVPIFDRLTPVNNILHSPTDLTDAHKNDPRKTDQTLFSSASSFNKMSKGDYEVEEALTTTQNTMVSGQHTDNTLTKLVNTIHALVNDESESENRVLTPDSEHSNHRIKSSNSVIVDLEGQAAGIDSIVKITKISLGDQYYRTKSLVNVKNGKKQICIPSTDKYKQYSPSVKVIRKPITKIQKFSINPKPRIEPRTELYSVDDFTHSMALIEGTNNRDARSSKICEKKSPGTKETSVFSVDKPCTSSVLVFDLLNPLNNILLAPTYFMDVHKYTDETLCGSRSSFNKILIGNDNDVENVWSTLYTRMPEPTTMQDDMNYIYQKGVQFDLQYASSTSGSISVEETRDAILSNGELNTMIVRRRNSPRTKKTKPG